jgi:hypothetical protein
MKKPPRHSLATFDGVLLEGLEFCRTVYEFFEQVQKAPGGVNRIRLRKDKTAKRLTEELMLLAAYVQSRYRAGRKIRVRWLSGSQPYDAILWSSGALVSHRTAPRREVVEITTSVHPNEHLRRQLLVQQKVSFGPEGIRRDKKTGELVSEPRGYKNDDRVESMMRQVLESIKQKAGKPYPPGTTLVVDYIAPGLILRDEWEQGVTGVNDALPPRSFQQIFLFEHVGYHSATLYGTRRRLRRR